MIDSLRSRWKELWQRFRVHPISPDVFEELVKAYSSKNRFYHNLEHIEDCLSRFEETKSLAAHPEEVEVAVWFHDSVYDTRRNDNEKKSAGWAVLVMEQVGLSSAVAERVSNSILATRHMTEVTNRDAQLMVDVDLSILGREADIFWKYEENIRKEYAWVPESVFREKRVEILQSFLERQSIYYHEPYKERFEEKARVNLKQAIARLLEAHE